MSQRGLALSTTSITSGIDRVDITVLTKRDSHIYHAIEQDRSAYSVRAFYTAAYFAQGSRYLSMEGSQRPTDIFMLGHEQSLQSWLPSSTKLQVLNIATLEENSVELAYVAMSEV